MLEEQESLRDKTTKIGQIARTCSIFGADSVQIFRDPRGKGEPTLIRHVLEYLETPQYLRRRLFPLDDSLKFAGLLPPLRIPSHKPKVPVDKIRSGEFREGVVLSDGVTADVGLDTPVRIREKLGVGGRVTIRIVSISPLAGVVVGRSEPTEYWGYTVEVRSTDEVLADTRFEMKLATSRLGDPLGESLPRLRESFARSRGVMALFGAPTRGLFDLVKDLRDRVTSVVNLYPEQAVVTVRTEEAIASGLYLLELIGALQNTKV